MKQIIIYLFIITFLLAEKIQPQITISLPDTSIETTKNIELPIYTSDLTGKGIYSYEFRLVYDKDILKPKAIIDDGTISDRRTWDINAYIDKQGLVVKANGWYRLYGEGTLLKIKFEILEDDGFTNLTFDPFRFNNGSPKPKIINGSFEVYKTRKVEFVKIGDGSGKVSVNNINYDLPVELKLRNKTTYNFLAIPDSKSLFEKWKGDISTSANPINYTITKNLEIKLEFSRKPLTVTASLNPQDFGYVEGVGIYNYGDLAILKANPYPGKKFTNWELNGTNVSTNEEYQFTVKNNVNLVANFENMLVQITASANPADGGHVTGSGYYFPDDTAKISATSSENWRFFNWTENGSIISQDSNLVFIVTGDRALMANYSLITSIDEVESSFNSFYLAPPYPNPFNPTTTFQFGLKKSSIVNLYILDIKGTIVSRLIEDKKVNSGIFETTFNANNLSSGVYFYLFEAIENQTNKKHIKTGKAILLK